MQLSRAVGTNVLAACAGVYANRDKSPIARRCRRAHHVAQMREPSSKNLNLTRRLHELVSDHPDFEVLGEPTLDFYCFRYVPNALAERPEEPDVQRLLDRLNQEIVASVQRGGFAYVMTIRVRGRAAIRISICSRRTLAEDVDTMFEAVARWGRLLNRKLSVRYEMTSDREAQPCLSESHSSPTEVSAT
jgi:glutamate/tyrosine decarboxylase-like PLP-dependent enzyme